MLNTFRLRLALAVSFMTRFPVRIHESVADADWAGSAAAYPVCGYLLGILAFGLPAALSAVLPQFHKPAPSVLPLAACAVAALAYFTRGLHLDGFGDVCDGFGGSFDKQRRLEIMKDPRTGSFAVVGITLLLIGKIAAVGVMFSRNQFLACIAVIAMSRFFVVAMAAAGRYPRDKGTAQMMVGRISRNTFVIAGLSILPCLLIPQMSQVFLVMTAAAAFLFRKANRAIGGVTGDVLGACAELCEAAGYITVALTPEP